jgi:hypothetical protein
MNLREDSLKVVADLQPASLDRLAEEGYARRRADDLARLLSEPSEPSGPGRRDRHLAVVRLTRGRVLAGAGAGLAAAAVAAALILVPSAPGHPTSGPATTPGRQGTPTAGLPAILLTAAHVAADRPMATGTYWYVKERDFEPTTTRYAGKLRPKAPPLTKGAPLGAIYAETEESWTGANTSRTIVNENLVFSFATAADKARWQAAGEPKLASAAGFGQTGPTTSNYSFGGYSYNIGVIKVSLASAGKLPTTPGKLDKLLRGEWNSLDSQQQADAVGLPNPSYGQFLFEWAEALLTGPVTPGTKASVYELLAKQPGLAGPVQVTDPLGRAGTAIGDGSGDYLIIDPATADVLDLTTYPVQPGATIAAAYGGTEAYLAMGWTKQIGVPSGS